MEYLFSVYWKDIEIGYCFKYKKKFVFMYNQNNIAKTRQFGFDKLIGFPNIDKIYINNSLFPIFESRIIAHKRLALKTNEDKIKYLISTKGKLVTDNISIKKKGLDYGQHRI